MFTISYDGVLGWCVFLRGKYWADGFKSELDAILYLKSFHKEEGQQVMDDYLQRIKKHFLERSLIRKSMSNMDLSDGWVECKGAA